MEYIQHVFMKVQNHMQGNQQLNELSAYLDSEPKEFRSVAYESAAMMIGLKDMAQGGQLNQWKEFYHTSKDQHSAHVEVGLGLAFGKLELTPAPYLSSLEMVRHFMVFDGIGYYYGLFKGRRTVFNREIPEFISHEQLHGFDQGLGRRMWYITKGNAKDVAGLIDTFPSGRQRDLWRGVGIACGYVGGNEKANLAMVTIYSGEFKKQLFTGVAMAALSRSVSESFTEDIELTCSMLYGKSIQNTILAKAGVMKTVDNKSHDSYPDWITQLEEEFTR
jgi:enediyne biosynthesis protein E3